MAKEHKIMAQLQTFVTTWMQWIFLVANGGMEF
jgi:hypothetical protein